MNKKINIMSLSLDPATQEKLRLHAKQKTSGNVSKLIREMVDRYVVAEDDVIPVIMKVPIELKGDEENLRKWLGLKMEGIVKALSN